MSPVQNLKGFRDFLGPEKRLRDWVEAKIAAVFRKYGFSPLETPTLEYADLLLGKYGAEADKLVYHFADQGGREVGLRYDQTVPTARVLVQYQGKLPKFYRRYQIQNVFRAEKPQHGRYREFKQCDADVFNTNSPLADAEILACTYFGIKSIGFEDHQVLVNDRKLLIATIEGFLKANPEVKLGAFSVIQSIDKLDKLSSEDVISELHKKDNSLTTELGQQLLAELEKLEPTENLSEIVGFAKALGVPAEAIVFTPYLARGLDYYTGMIFEIVSPRFKGSLAGGGRYDNLIASLGGGDVPAVGVAFGFDRLVELLSADRTDEMSEIKKVLICPLDEDSLNYAAESAASLRADEIETVVSIYPEADKLGKQLKYASDNGYDYALIVGSEEREDRKIAVKNLKTSEQAEFNFGTTPAHWPQ